MHPPDWPESTLRADLLHQLPRELRDQIYDLALSTSQDIWLKLPLLPHIPPILRDDPNLLPEALQSLCKVNTIVCDCEAALKLCTTESTIVNVKPQNHVRHLKIECNEMALDTHHLSKHHRSSSNDRHVRSHSHREPQMDYEDIYAYEKASEDCSSRKKWTNLLDFPRLKDLTVYMQKRGDGSLNTLNFAPLLYVLRHKKPDVKITFNLSFDKMLERLWSDTASLFPDQTFQGDDISPDEPYQPMGWVDISDLVAPPTQADIDHVHTHLPDYVNTWRMPGKRSIREGLLDQTPAGRRALAKHYAVHEPELLRCQMQNHYKLYQQYREDHGKSKVPEWSVASIVVRRVPLLTCGRIDARNVKPIEGASGKVCSLKCYCSSTIFTSRLFSGANPSKKESTARKCTKRGADQPTSWYG